MLAPSTGLGGMLTEAPKLARRINPAEQRGADAIALQRHWAGPHYVEGVNRRRKLTHRWPQKRIDELMPWLWVLQQPP